MSNTFGDFAVAVAFGQERSRTMSEQESNRAHQEMCEAVGPVIAAIRSEQRKTDEDALSMKVF
ncbi:hypothetical protein [Xanthomonas campestris]|uniref:hypothetical protein n=1 Tax=Xanthomonas campestris TaxID=339 RepID=UPI0023585838|nr:hypothetical protein [Xanthomonas campestris]MDC8744676.1 hypothetical protein [Xanthomonas campestris]MDM7688662.1 hypothetical protein [Xanthomonas campestris pv. campestris]